MEVWGFDHLPYRMNIGDIQRQRKADIVYRGSNEMQKCHPITVTAAESKEELCTIESIIFCHSILTPL